MTDDVKLLARPDGENLAYSVRTGTGPGILFLHGFRSDMTGTKAQALDQWAARRGKRLARFDCFGHGRSSGDFLHGSIGRWLDDSLAMLEIAGPEPVILVGSSMGGWLALLAARARPENVKALVLIAPAPDFTEELMWPNLPEPARAAILKDGLWRAPSLYDAEPYPITRHLIEDGRNHLVLSAPLVLNCPVRVLQGMADPDVPWRHATRLVDHLRCDDVVLTLIKDGDHRLSRPQDLARLEVALDEVVQ